MTGLQVIVNIFIAIALFIVTKWLCSYMPNFPDVVSTIIGLIAVIVTFTANLAARIGVR